MIDYLFAERYSFIDSVAISAVVALSLIKGPLYILLAIPAALISAFATLWYRSKKEGRNG